MRDTVAFFCMPDRGHFQRLRPLIRGLTDLGVRAVVYTGEAFRSDAEEAGGRFVDLFARYPIEAADAESWPIPVRYVSFAAHYAEAISEDVEADGASLIVHDSFAVIGSVVARALGIAHVAVCSGHAIVPEQFLAIMRALPIVRVAPECEAAVDTLRTRWGIADASPFAYISELSPHLNVYCEPPEFLDPAHRAVFEPIAFYGSLHPERRRVAADPTGLFAGAPDGALKTYVSFGTNIWDYRMDDALSALATIADALEADGAAQAVISLGGAEVGERARARLARHNVRVESYVDQWSLLREADLFVTHHGLNSTHEAVWWRVPMASYPFIWDQPGLMRRCRELGFGFPLTDEPMSKIAGDVVAEALTWRRERSAPIAAALEAARRWEEAVIAQRPAVHERVLDLRA